MKNLKPHLAIIATNVIFGINISVSRSLIPDKISPYTLSFFRMIGALVLFWLISLFLPKEKVSKKDIFLLLLAGFIGIFINQMSFLVGLASTSPVDASIILTLLPVNSMILAAIFLKEPISAKKVIGVLIGATGIVFLILNNSSDKLGSGNLYGNLLILCSSLSYAFYLTLFKRLVSRYSPVTVMKWMFLMATICVLPVSWEFLQDCNLSSISAFTISQILFVVIFATFITYILIPVGQKKLRPTLLSMYNYLQPLIAMAIAIYYGQSSFGWDKILAAILVFAGVYVVSISRAKES